MQYAGNGLPLMLNNHHLTDFLLLIKSPSLQESPVDLLLSCFLLHTCMPLYRASFGPV